VAAQRFEKGLKAATDHTAHDLAVYLYVADSSRALDDLGGRWAHKTDLHAAYRQLLGHDRHATRRAAARNPLNY